MKQKKSIILGVTASIAIYKACEILRRLQDQSFSVSVVMTEEAKELIRPVVFQSLSGNRVYGSLFGDPDVWEVEHVSLAERCDLILVAPATANIIGKIANGICDNLLTCLLCATRKPVVICPAMNELMFRNRIVQENIRKLKSHGYKFVEPIRGRLACGKVGIGCLAEVETIVKEVKRIL
ncbi:MAG: phosphopantothenoylcysteine decarboxylase [Omnitrophica WOR_2 bacterium SM23_72]|nr:MAG: phosphopantothenoylcysteine decarboxylase [Omnitrophica WOR_2 bacterium SM23_72]